jgi:unsaturated rhamnogalacturonyl hydrolase
MKIYYKLSLLFCFFISIFLGAQESENSNKPKRENIEWADIWLPNTNDTGLPRVLLIGNSITRQYYPEVQRQLNGKAYVGRLSTSKSLGDPGLLKEVALVLSYEHFDVVHFNNGMHGWDYSEEEYAKAFPDLYNTICKGAPDAKLIWATTTPVKTGENMTEISPKTKRVEERNRIAYEYLKDKNVQIDDLFSLAINNTAFYGGNDGVHLRPIGVKALATQVADQIMIALGETPGLDDFPQGYTPQEIGNKLSHHLLHSPHYTPGGKNIHYAEVCTWLGALRYGEEINDQKLLDSLAMRFEPFFSTEKNLLPAMNHVDLNMFGCLPLELYMINKDRRYYDLGMQYADTQWKVPSNATKEQKDFAKKGYSWQTRLWIDDMFMITIIQSQAYRATGNKKYLDRAAREMVYYLDELQEPNGLFYHAPDVPFYWARGNGWMAAGMTEVLKALPMGSKYRDRILKGYRTMMQSLKQYQGKDGMWNQLIDEPDFWPETSGSAMFAYAIISGIRHGWLDKDEYTPVARRAWLALVPYINDNGDVREVCVGTNKKNDRQYYYDRPRITGDYHGQAPYLWCVDALLEEIK